MDTDQEQREDSAKRHIEKQRENNVEPIQTFRTANRAGIVEAYQINEQYFATEMRKDGETWYDISVHVGYQTDLGFYVQNANLTGLDKAMDMFEIYGECERFIKLSDFVRNITKEQQKKQYKVIKKTEKTNGSFELSIVENQYSYFPEMYQDIFQHVRESCNTYDYVELIELYQDIYRSRLYLAPGVSDVICYVYVI